MDRISDTRHTDSRICDELFDQVMDAIAPWACQNGRKIDDWHVSHFSHHEEQILLGIAHKYGLERYSALICCLEKPEIMAVSSTNGTLGMLNPFIDGAGKIEDDLDAPGCWNILSVSFAAESGCTAVRYIRDGKFYETEVNQFGSFDIHDWHSNRPIDRYLATRIEGVWHDVVVPQLPYSQKHIKTCWKKAVISPRGMNSRWNKWITSVFSELGKQDRAKLQDDMLRSLATSDNMHFLEAFKAERRAFLQRERAIFASV